MEGDLLSQTQWQDFIRGDIWKALLWEIQDRESYLIDLFKENDQVWDANTIRGKLTELEYIKQIPQSILASIIIKEANSKNREELNDEEIMERTSFVQS